MKSDFANKFAEEWIAAWNAHDLVQILSHYTEDFEMSSPVIKRLMREPSGKLKGKESISRYWEKALAQNPDLRFVLRNLLIGANSITIIYEGVRGLSAEVLHFNISGKVTAAYAHYAP